MQLDRFVLVTQIDKGFRKMSLKGYPSYINVIIIACNIIR